MALKTLAGLDPDLRIELDGDLSSSSVEVNAIRKDAPVVGGC